MDRVRLAQCFHLGLPFERNPQIEAIRNRPAPAPIVRTQIEWTENNPQPRQRQAGDFSRAHKIIVQRTMWLSNTLFGRERRSHRRVARGLGIWPALALWEQFLRETLDGILCFMALGLIAGAAATAPKNDGRPAPGPRRPNGQIVQILKIIVHCSPDTIGALLPTCCLSVDQRLLPDPRADEGGSI